MRQKRKTGRRLLSFLLTLSMVVGLMPGMGLTAYAENAEDVTGECRESVTCKLKDTDEDSNYDKLTITGTGAMNDYSSSSDSLMLLTSHGINSNPLLQLSRLKAA